MKYVYPAVFKMDKETKCYEVEFPDIEQYTSGDSLADAFEMAEDLLALMLCHYEIEGTPIPKASKIGDIKLKKGEFANYINCDTTEYKKRYNSKSVRKSVTVPEWLSEKASRANINISQVLQEALIEKLGI